MSSDFNENDNIKNIDKLPSFSGPSKNGGRVFKATPHVVNSNESSFIKSNIVSIIFFSVLFIIGIVVYLFSKNSDSSLLNYMSGLVIFFSGIMSAVLAVSLPWAVSSYKKMISKIYIEVSPGGIEGITADENRRYVFFNIGYGDIKDIVYNSMQLSIYLKDGRFFNYNVFYNTREIYNTIVEMGGNKLKI